MCYCGRYYSIGYPSSPVLALTLIGNHHGLKVAGAGVSIGDVVRLRRLEDYVQSGAKICQNAPPEKVFVCVVLGLEPLHYPVGHDRIDALAQIAEVKRGMERERGD